MNLVVEAKKLWAALPANVQICIHGLGSAAFGGASTAAAVYFADHDHHNLAALRESLGIILAGAVAAAALYLKGSPMPGYRWDRAIEKGTAVERRASTPVLPPAVVVLPETPPGDPLGDPAPTATPRPLVDALRERQPGPRDTDQ